MERLRAFSATAAASLPSDPSAHLHIDNKDCTSPELKENIKSNKNVKLFDTFYNTPSLTFNFKKTPAGPAFFNVLRSLGFISGQPQEYLGKLEIIVQMN